MKIIFTNSIDTSVLDSSFFQILFNCLADMQEQKERESGQICKDQNLL